jgi:hypothetical protein
MRQNFIVHDFPRAVLRVARHVSLVQGAGARTARIAARPAGSGRLICPFAADGETGELLAQPLALALGAARFLFAQNYGLKAVVALLTDVFENRHISQLS